MNNRYNLVTIFSALIFLFLTIFPENNKNNFIIYILIFTSIIYKYLHIYNNTIRDKIFVVLNILPVAFSELLSLVIPGHFKQ